MTTTDRTALSDLAVATLRTVVPVAWGTLVAQVLAWAAPHLTPALADALTAWLSAETAIALVTMVAIAVWYALWRRLEHLVPDWLVRLVLGSARTPAYTLPRADTLTALTGGTVPGTALDTYVAGTLDAGRIIAHEIRPNLSDEHRAALVELRALLADVGTADPAVAALDTVLHT